MVKDPDSGKRLSHPNPEREWQTVEILAMVPGALSRYRKNARPNPSKSAASTATLAVWFASVRRMWDRHVNERQGQNGAYQDPLLGSK